VKVFVGTVEKLVQHGLGIVRRPGGKICLVPGVLPQETVKVCIRKEHKGWAEGDLVNVQEPSRDRVPPACPHAGDCGGCAMGHVHPDVQPRLKAMIAEETIHRLGGLRPPGGIAVTASPLAWGYRHRLRLHAGETGDLGFFQGKSRRFVPVTRCRLGAASPQDALLALRGCRAWEASWGKTRDVAAVSAPIPSSPNGTTILILTARGIPLPIDNLREILAQVPGIGGVHSMEGGSAQVQGVGDGSIICHLPRDAVGTPFDIDITCPARCFTQVNWNMNIRVIRRVRDMANDLDARRILELYSGVGNFSLPLASVGARVTGIEQDGSAVEAARKNADAMGLHGAAHFIQGPAETILPEHMETGGPTFDMVILDPPRSGAATACQVLASSGIPHVLYLSCNPATLARDMRILNTSGYRLEWAEAYDFFPQTAHVEVLAFLALDKFRNR